MTSVSSSMFEGLMSSISAHYRVKYVINRTEIKDIRDLLKQVSDMFIFHQLILKSSALRKLSLSELTDKELM